MDRFSSAFVSNKYDQFVHQDIMPASNSEATGTPTLFINGKRMQQRSFNDFKFFDR